MNFIHCCAQQYKLGGRNLEETLYISHLNNHSLQLGVVLDGHLAILSAKA